MQTNTLFNPTQLHLLKLFSINKTEEKLVELKTALMEFYQKKLNQRLNDLWDKGEITRPYKCYRSSRRHLEAGCSAKHS